MTPPWLSCLGDAVAWVTDAYPQEGCGLVLQRGNGFRFHGCRNLADAHSARSSYVLDPLELVRAEDRGEHVVAIVHSHPDARDDFSDQDIAAALMPPHGGPPEPAHPDVDYLVVSTGADGADHASLYRFDRTSERAFARVWDAELPGDYAIHSSPNAQADRAPLPIGFSSSDRHWG